MGGELKSFHDQIRAVFLLFASVLVPRRMKAIYNVMSSISLGADMQCQEAEWEGKALFLKNTEWLLYAEAPQRESRLGSWVGLPWKFVPYSLQVTNSWKSFTRIISSYCCACGYFLYSLRAFHWKRHQHFLASGNKNIFRLQLPKPALRLQESTSAAGCLGAVRLPLDQWRHSFASHLFVASSQTTCTRDCIPFLHRCFEEGVGRLGLSVILSNAEDIGETQAVCSQGCTMKGGQKLLNKSWNKERYKWSQEKNSSPQKRLSTGEGCPRGCVISIPGVFQNSAAQEAPRDLTSFGS